jgi:heme/copper-type cytochrome/quinol oxidase subunit 2
MRLGIRMFAIYALFYAGFVLINLISPATMGEIVLFGLNLATVYGFGLIFLAVAQALVYHVMCRRKEDEYERAEKAKSAISTTVTPGS